MKIFTFPSRLLIKSLLLLFILNFQLSTIKAQTTVTFYFDSVVQNYLVPAGVTTMTITAVGAMGGGSGNDVYAAGYGASITGKCTVTPGHNLSIVVGQLGYSSDFLNTGGGGGGSFVYDSNNSTIFVIAGGGGGEGYSSVAGGANGGNGGIVYNSPYTPTGSPQGSGAIVSGGHGGNRGVNTLGNGPGAGGAGWITNGDSVGGGSAGDPFGGPFPCGGGKDRTNFFNGGNALSYGPDVNYGGYGGGGGGGYTGGGGGGGYNGGGGGNDLGNSGDGGGGGGGGSYLHGTIVGTPTATNDSNGYVIISYFPPVLTVTAAVTTQVSCHGNNTGKATATASYGTPPYTYSWNNGQTNAAATGLSAGSYTITVTDNASATATAAVTITQPAANLAISIASHTNVLCRGTNTGSATANAATGGTSPYTYSWTPSGGTGLTASNLTANTYTVKVTDAHGCTASASVTLTQPASAVGITIASHSDILCNGNNTGSITANGATGGTSPYTYAWAPAGGNGLIASNLSAATYTITATDNQGCTGSASVAVTQPATAVSVTISSETDALCFGNNGTAIASANGGTGTITYLWNDANSTAGATLSAPAGSYTVTAKDANNCTSTATVTIGQPASAVNVIISSSTNASCYGNNGTANASATGGTGAFTYSWNDANSTVGATLLASAGTYTVTAKDANGCMATTSVTITQPLSAVTVTITSETDALCHGNTGSATANATGGTGAFTYSWNDANSTAGPTLSATAGTYTVTAKDANGCTATASVTIGQPASTISVSITSETDALCYGNNGSATAGATGGTGAFTYSWNDANSTAGATLSATAGTYTVTAKDANGCTGTASVTINQPASAVNVTINSSTNISCYGNNGSATAGATGGTGAFTYSWNDANSTVGATLSATAGTYTVTAKDANGCTATVSVTITQPSSPVTVSITSEINALCYGSNGSATASGSGGTGTITYKWNDANSTAGATLSDIAGTYTVTAKDANGCTATASVTIGQPSSAITVSISSETNAVCHGNDGSAVASASGGTGTITYKWNDANSTVGATLSALAGTYTVTAKDANGCTATASVTIGQPNAFTTTITVLANPTCNGNATGNASANPSGGSSPYTYKWTNGTSTAVSTSNPTGAVLPAHAYTLTVTDNHGCTATATVTITQPQAVRDSIINVTNPNCNNNGTATLGVKYGTLPYTYFWAPGGMTTATVSGLGAQTYTATVTDNHGCAGTTRKIEIINTGSTLRDSISLLVNVGCTGGNAGELTAGTRGGITPYTYAWSNGATAYTVSNLTAGSYSVTITDNTGCSNILMATITQPATALSAVQASISYPECHAGKGSASVTVSGGTPGYKYAWAPVTNTTASSTNLTAGTYTVTVTDAHNCKSIVNIIITQPNAIRDTSVSASKVNVTCYGLSNGSATIGVKYGTSPYSYSWSNGQTNATATGLTAGVYSVTVTDINGCSGTTAAITITQPASALSESISAPTCTNNLVTATVTAAGGTSPYTYLWSPGGSTKATVSGLTQGVYLVRITDKHGCSDTLSKNLLCGAVVRQDGLDKGTSPECCSGLDNISLYPNPNTGQFTLTGLEQGMIVEMYDYTGRKVSVITAGDITMQINISDQPNGIYLLRILDNSGNLVSRKKVVKTN